MRANRIDAASALLGDVFGAEALSQELQDVHLGRGQQRIVFVAAPACQLLQNRFQNAANIGVSEGRKMPGGRQQRFVVEGGRTAIYELTRDPSSQSGYRIGTFDKDASRYSRRLC